MKELEYKLIPLYVTVDNIEVAVKNIQDELQKSTQYLPMERIAYLAIQCNCLQTMLIEVKKQLQNFKK